MKGLFFQVSNGVQKKLDFERGDQLAAINELEFSGYFTVPSEGKTQQRIHAVILKAVLLQLDHFCRGKQGFPSQELMARRLGISTATLRRAYSILESLSLIIRTRQSVGDGTRTVSTRYTIVYTECRLLADRSPVTDQMHQSSSSETTATSADRPLTDEQRTLTDQYRPLTDEDRTLTGERLSDQKRKEPPQPDVAAEAISILRRGGVSARVAIELSGEHSAELIKNVVMEYENNRARLKGPGSIVYRLRYGEWPSNGVITPNRMAEAMEARAAKLAHDEREGTRYRVITSMRRAGQSDAEIEACLASIGLDW